ncbi:DUF6339 family protein [Anaerosacchariphilus polymeriproducens]|uniref:Uncharacterized protein n=1 Tax=Anaerosacchariphilus polymeriproducens TaxID=1812858 RepID=A0A371AUI7_9FIRM|nr:DUF6339 family protein [Anaerosacchariphilus polymeriproducens]RDU23233.1 hypothetical protein DWV06_10675 [Anaerosacchariphilus polymeriproducens]
MKIKYMIEDDLNTLKSNLPGVFKEVVAPGGISINKMFSREDMIKNTPYEIDEFTLDMSQPKGKESLTDVENIQRVYNHMKFLSDSQASDERIWLAYTFSEFIDYMRYRWTANSVSDLENRYLFGYSVQRSLFRNGIARLWWIGRFTYDLNRLDPYELTKFLCKDQDYIESICGRNIFNNPDVGVATVSALFDAEKNGKTVNRDVVRNMGKYVNVLAGTYLLDSLSREEIYNKVSKKLAQ